MWLPRLAVVQAPSSAYSSYSRRGLRRTNEFEVHRSRQWRSGGRVTVHHWHGCAERACGAAESVPLIVRAHLRSRWRAARSAHSHAKSSGRAQCESASGKMIHVEHEHAVLPARSPACTGVWWRGPWPDDAHSDAGRPSGRVGGRQRRDRDPSLCLSDTRVKLGTRPGWLAGGRRLWPMADAVARGGIGSLRAPCSASGTRYVSMRELIGSRRVPFM
jgi:hypothetical protein